MNSKGQFFSYDAIIAGAIFLLAIALILSYWNGVQPNQETDLSRETLRLSETLLTAGFPPDWEKNGNPKSIGLAEKQNSRVLSPEKLAEFRRMSESGYEEVKPILLTGNEYWIEISGENLDCGGPCSFGKKPPENAERSSATRLVVLNGKPARLTVNLWKIK